MYLVDCIALVESLLDNEDTHVGRSVERTVDVGDLKFLVLDKAVHSLSDHAEPFLNSLLECSADGHDLSDRLHR